MKKCRFEVEVSYDEQFFAEGEIQETLRTSIEILGEKKVNRYGRDTFMKNGWIKGIDAKVEKTKSDEPKLELNDQCIAELIAISGVSEEEIPDKDVPKLSEVQLEQLLAKVRTEFSKK
jgi:hypothetical protein